MARNTRATNITAWRSMPGDPPPPGHLVGCHGPVRGTQSTGQTCLAVGPYLYHRQHVEPRSGFSVTCVRRALLARHVLTGVVCYARTYARGFFACISASCQRRSLACSVPAFIRSKHCKWSRSFVGAILQAVAFLCRASAATVVFFRQDHTASSRVPLLGQYSEWSRSFVRALLQVVAFLRRGNTASGCVL